MALRHAFEFHDGTVYAARVNGPDAVVTVRICVHASEGEPGVESGVSWFQDAEVLFSEFVLLEGVDEALGWDISDGSIIVDGETFRMVPLPFDKTGRIRIELLGVGGEKLVASGSALQVVLTGEPGPVEHF